MTVSAQSAQGAVVVLPDPPISDVCDANPIVSVFTANTRS